MAWGMFCWIPCPYKGWREEDRKAQIAMLPLIGACMGAIVCLVWFALTYIGAGQFITGVILTAVYFLLTGYIHLDGFMDCSDAVMPRHPQMEERVRILKDPHNGAFGIVCVCLMLVIFAGAMIEIAPFCEPETCSILILIFTASRSISAIEVLICRPMPSSQYAKARKTEPMGSFADTIPVFIILIIVLGTAELINSGFAWWSLIAEPISNIAAAVVLIAAAVTGSIDRRKLGGMNGDISGHMITMSEMFGVMAVALMV